MTAADINQILTGAGSLAITIAHGIAIVIGAVRGRRRRKSKPPPQSPAPHGLRPAQPQPQQPQPKVNQ